jgi:hypothetical protein
MSECPCCANLTLDERDAYSICPVCFWEDDPGQAVDLDDENGANSVSLRQARANYKSFGASEESMKKNVRKPEPHELKN